MLPKDSAPRACETCGNPLKPTQTRYCSNACRDARMAHRTYTCETCAEPFRPNTRTQRFCCASCRSKATWAIRRGEQPSLHGGRIEHTCPKCGTVFEDDALTKRKYCSPQCRDDARRTNHPRPCAVCGTVFTPTHRKDQRFCSLECGFVGGRKRGAKPTGWNAPIPCARCGTMFTPVHMRGQLYCSRPCGLLARHERDVTSGKRIARPLRMRCHKTLTDAVVARDGAVCYLCHDAIDLTLSGHDMMGLTIDHVIPLARGGSHTLANLKPAHRICNARKNIRTPEEYLG